MSHPQQSSLKQGEYSRSADGVKRTKKCYECGEMGHLRWECPRLQQCYYQPSQMQFQQINSLCIYGRQPQREEDFKQGKPATKSEQGPQGKVYALASQNIESNALVEGMILCFST